MHQELEALILSVTKAESIVVYEAVQTLWSGYGTIWRCVLENGNYPSVVVKHIQLPEAYTHPRGGSTNASHQRKVQSYEIEKNWYSTYARQCTDVCRVPKFIAYQKLGNEDVLIMEDLNNSGFSRRKSMLKPEETKPVLKWLANFHALFMQKTSQGLWPIGTYWHLETRCEEWQAMENGLLKQKASQLHEKLNHAAYKTLVHGDAKVANFCFSREANKVAAVDFQYVGAGCGIKDVAYFFGNCLTEKECFDFVPILLDYYFQELKKALRIHNPFIDFPAVELEYRNLFPIAWTDFTRFLVGWSPTHNKINAYSKYMMVLALGNEE